MRIIEHVVEDYDVQDVEFGKIYVWCPESVLVECECGERATIKRSELLSGTIHSCDCGKDQMSGIREEIQKEEEVVGRSFKDDKVVHPWRYWHPSEQSGIPF